MYTSCTLMLLLDKVSRVKAMDCTEVACPLHERDSGCVHGWVRAEPSTNLLFRHHHVTNPLQIQQRGWWCGPLCPCEGGILDGPDRTPLGSSLHWPSQRCSWPTSSPGGRVISAFDRIYTPAPEGVCPSHWDSASLVWVWDRSQVLHVTVPLATLGGTFASNTRSIDECTFVVADV